MFGLTFSADLILQYTIIFLTIGMLISNLEYLANYKIFTNDGLLSWRIIETRWQNGYIKRMIGFLFKNNLVNALFLFRVVLLFIILLVPPLSLVSWIAMMLIISTYAISNLFTFYGSDGSDQMSNLILVAIFLSATPFTSEKMLTIGFIFIAAQSCLSYFVAGVSKIFSKAWRSGDAVKDIFRTRTYGSKEVYEFIKDKKMLNIFLCWSVFIMEILFPLVLILPLEYGILFLVWGVVFHLLNSLIMGLNTFLWAFLASYPSIIFLNLLIAT